MERGIRKMHGGDGAEEYKKAEKWFVTVDESMLINMLHVSYVLKC